MLNYATILNKGIIHSDYLNDDIYNLLDRTFIFPVRGYNFNIFRVTENYIARPDLISLDAYGDTQFTDIICKLNGISNPFELDAGMLLVLPAPENLMDFYVSPSQDEIEAEETDNITGPQPKSKTDKKRKPNEAIIGSSRFKIDKGSGVIIY